MIILTPTAVAEMRLAYVPGQPYEEIAARYGVRPSTAFQAIHACNWAWVPERAVVVLPGSGELLRQIAIGVCERHGVTLAEIVGPSTRRRFSDPRHEAMAAAYATGRFSLPRIGAFFGNRHHTTVLGAVRRLSGYEPPTRNQDRCGRIGGQCKMSPPEQADLRLASSV